MTELKCKSGCAKLLRTSARRVGMWGLLVAVAATVSKPVEADSLIPYECSGSGHFGLITAAIQLANGYEYKLKPYLGDKIAGLYIERALADAAYLMNDTVEQGRQIQLLETRLKSATLDAPELVDYISNGLRRALLMYGDNSGSVEPFERILELNVFKGPHKRDPNDPIFPVFSLSVIPYNYIGEIAEARVLLAEGNENRLLDAVNKLIAESERLEHILAKGYVRTTGQRVEFDLQESSLLQEETGRLRLQIGDLLERALNAGFDIDLADIQENYGAAATLLTRECVPQMHAIAKLAEIETEFSRVAQRKTVPEGFSNMSTWFSRRSVLAWQMTGLLDLQYVPVHHNRAMKRLRNIYRLARQLDHTEGWPGWSSTDWTIHLEKWLDELPR